MIKRNAIILVIMSCFWFGIARADTSIQLLPPTPIGSTVDCPAGFQQVLTWSGTPSSGAQGGINCVPINADAAGDISTNGYVQTGASNATCSTSTAGAIRFNPSATQFEGCDGTNWTRLGGGLTIVEGGCLSNWAGCPAGYVPTSYFSPGTYNCCDRCGNPAWRYTVCSQQ